MKIDCPICYGRSTSCKACAGGGEVEVRWLKNTPVYCVPEAALVDKAKALIATLEAGNEVFASRISRVSAELSQIKQRMGRE